MKIIKIGASWCSGCIIMKKRFEEIEKQRTFESEYYDFDIYEDMLVEKYNIGDKLPIFIFVNDKDEEIKRLIGEPTIEEIIKVLDGESKWKKY